MSAGRLGRALGRCYPIQRRKHSWRGPWGGAPVTERWCPGRDRKVSGGRSHRLGGSESGQAQAGRGTGPVLACRAEPGRLGPIKRRDGPVCPGSVLGVKRGLLGNWDAARSVWPCMGEVRTQLCGTKLVLGARCVSAQRERSTWRERKLGSSEEVGGVRVKQRMKRKGKIIEGVEAESAVREDEGRLRPGPRAFPFFPVIRLRRSLHGTLRLVGPLVWNIP